MSKRALAFVRLFGAATKAWWDDDAPRLGASLAYYTLFAIAPVLVVATAIAGMVFGPEAVRGEIAGQLDGLVGREGAVAVQSLLEGASQRRPGMFATVIGGIAFVVAATGAFLELQVALNVIWRVKVKPGINVSAFLMDRVRSFSLVIAIGFLLLVSLAVTAALAALNAWLSQLSPGIPMVWTVVSVLVSIAVTTGLFALLFRFLPDVRLRWRDVTTGALVTATLFTIGQQVIGLYLGQGSVASSYGAAGSMMILLLWVYYSCQILLFGAEFTRVYALSRGARPAPETFAEKAPAVQACLLAVCLVIAGCSPDTPVADTSGAFIAGASTAIRAQLDATGPIEPDDRTRTDLARLYEKRVHAPLWVDGFGRPTADARAAVALLEAADSEGLDPVDYDARQLSDKSAEVRDAATPEAAPVATFDIQLSANVLRYLRHLHMGRVDPRTSGFHITAPYDDHDFTEILLAAVERHRVAETAAEWRPPLALYRRLTGTLARYRALAADPAIQPPPPWPAAVRPGQETAHLAALAAWLRALGDLPPGAAPSGSSLYEGAIVDGVKAFQARHGLEPDGVLGKATQAALGVPLANRVRQIGLSLERLRWLPHLDDRFVAVNIPMFRLWGWDGVPPDGAPSFDMDVIVGRSLDTQTPVFIDAITHIIFRPYWNVPPSILKDEVLPALGRNPGYLDDQEMEIVDGQGDNAPVVPLSDDSLARLRAGRLRLRQRPGAKNSLGLVKFVFPNDDNIYMHGTPAPYLFSRSRRDLSHGCVRVVDPIGLALRLLADQPDWTRARIVAAMESGEPSRVELARPLQVVLFYLTAVAMPEDGRAHFASDIYGHDEALERALAARRAAR